MTHPDRSDSTSAALTGRRGPDGPSAPDHDRASEPSTYHVYGRLLSEATSELHGWARQALDDALARVQLEIDHKFAELLERAYTRGVRDGYVQAVTEQSHAE